MYFDLTTFSFETSGRSADALAVIGADRSLSWAALAREAQAWAEQAQAAGLARDVPVVIRGHKEASFFVAMVGALMMGAPFVPVDTIYPQARMDRIVEIVCPAVIYDALSNTFTQPAVAGRSAVEKGLAYVLFTSGSTGDPKGVQIGRESVGLLGQWMKAAFELGDAPVFMNQAPFSFDLSMYEVFGTLCTGGTCVLNAREAIGTASWLPAMAQQEISVWVSTPSFAHQQLVNRQFSAQGLPSLKVFLFCGEPLPRTLALKLRERFPDALVINTYGPTEATVATTWVIIDDAVLAAERALPIGQPKPDSLVFVEDGELCIVGDHVMRGYLNRPDLNETRMFTHTDGRRGFRTGDLGEVGEDGLLYCRGRMDDQIKLNGYRIELSEVDAALASLPGVSAAACAVLRRPDGTPVRLVGFIELARATSAPTITLPDALSQWRGDLALRLPSYMVPPELVNCPALPVSSNHKVDRKQLLQWYGAL